MKTEFCKHEENTTIHYSLFSSFLQRSISSTYNGDKSTNVVFDQPVAANNPLSTMTYTWTNALLFAPISSINANNWISKYATYFCCFVVDLYCCSPTSIYCLSLPFVQCGCMHWHCRPSMEHHRAFPKQNTELLWEGMDVEARWYIHSDTLKRV